MQTVKFKLVRFTSKKLADKTNPIVLRLTINKQRHHWSMYDYRSDNIKLNASEKNWNPHKSRYKGKDVRNEDLDYIERRIKTHLDDIRHNKQTLTIQGLKDLLFVKADTSSFYSLIEAQIKELEGEGRFGSASTYKDTYSAVKRFMKGKDVPLSGIDKNWLVRFKKFLKPNCQITTINIYLRCTRRIFNIAIGNNIINRDLYPFGGGGGQIKIGDANPKKRALTKDEMLSMINLDVSGHMQDSQNYFTFSYLTRGMNFKDMALLRWDMNIKGNRIEYIRSKTENKDNVESISIPIGKRIDEILASYTESENYIFPIIIDLKLNEKTKRYRIQNARKKTNKQIKEIAGMAGVKNPDEITFYTVRHTYATVLKRHGESVEMISELLGHEDISTTQRYLKKFSDDVKDATQDHLL